MTSFLDDPVYEKNVFYPRPDAHASPALARDVLIKVEPEVRLHARIHDAPRAKADLVLFHGNGEIVSDYDALAERFEEAGARLVVVDYRGYGRSEGSPSLRSLLGDARAVIEGLRPELSRDGAPLPLLVMGRSLGSVPAAELARSLPRFASGFVFESGFSDLVSYAIRRGVERPVVHEADMDALSPLRKLAGCHAPALVIHGQDDVLIAAKEGRALFEAAGASDKHLTLLQGRGHNDVSLDPAYWEALAAFVDRASRAADRRAGSLVAQALGDALGFLVEGQPPGVCAAYARATFASDAPPIRVRGNYAFGQYSDDTQLARELALSLTHKPAWSPSDYGRRIAAIFESNAIVGRGRATEAAAKRLMLGVSWDEAGEPSPSAGNGGAMRAAPVGLRYSDARERVRIADEQAKVTHKDARARAAAVLVAEVVADALANGAHAAIGSTAWCAPFASRVHDLDPVLAEMVTKLPALIAGDEAEATATIAAAGRVAGPRMDEHWQGISPYATPSALFAVYAFAKSPADPSQVLARAIAPGGDVDTVAAMAGAMAGAAVGLAGFDDKLRAWSAHLNDHGAFGAADLVALGHALA